MEKGMLFSKGINILVMITLILSSQIIIDSSFVGEASGAVTARTGNGSHNITLFLHNVSDSEASKTIPGSGSTWNWFDSAADFNTANTTLTASGTNNRFDWYMYPALADNMTTSSISLKIWAKAGTGSSQNANIQLEIYERDSTGSETLVKATGFGSQTFPAVGTLWTWTSDFGSTHTFSKGSTIKVRMIANPGTSKIVYFYYDSLAANSRVIIPTSDHIYVNDIETRDQNGDPTTVYSVTVSNKTADIRALVDDPFGGYDIKWVNITITGPNGTIHVNKVGMKKISGNPIDLTLTYQYLFNYTDLPSGRYNITIWALDNSGYNHYHHFNQFTFGEYPITAEGNFFIGGQPNFLWLRVRDDLGRNLSGALVQVKISSSVSAFNFTNSSGMTNITVVPGIYSIQVIWQDVVVAKLNYSVSVNVTSDDPVLINASVIYPTITVLDNASIPIHKAAVYLVHPNGSKLDPIQTDTSGNISLVRLPAGSWDVIVRWRGVVINTSSLDLNSSSQYIVMTTVYYLTVVTRDLSGSLMINIGISAFENETGLILDFKLTGPNGQAVLRVPKTTLDLEAYWLNLPVNSTFNIQVQGDMNITVICSIYNVPVIVTDPHGMPVSNAAVVFWTYPGGDLLGTGRTDEQGATNLKLVDGQYTMEVRWMDAVVNRSLVIVQSGGQVNVIANIFYMNLTVLDTAGDIIADVKSITYTPIGTVISAQTLDSEGNGILRLPVGQVRLTILWKGILVYDSQIAIDADLDLDLTVSVHQIEFNILDSHSQPLPLSIVNIYLNSTGELISTGITNTSGSLILRSASVSVDIIVIWKDIFIHSGSDLIFLDSGYWNITADVYYIEFQVYDSNNAPVNNAVVKLSIAGNGNVLGSNTTNALGTVVIRLPATSIDIEVFWKNYLVYTETGFSVIEDAVKIIEASIFYITFKALDSMDISVEEASIDAFDQIDPSPITSGITDEYGLVQMKIPIGTFEIETRWFDVVVNTTTLVVTQNVGEFVLHLSIYYIDFHVIDSKEIPVSGAVVYVERNDSGRLMGSGITSTSGRVTLRLPGTTTDISIYWDEVKVYEETGYEILASEEKTINSWIYYLDLVTLDKMGDSVGDSKIYLGTEDNVIKYKDTTSPNGMVTFRLPLDDYNMEIFWKNILVYTGEIPLSEDVSDTVILNIFHVTYDALDSRGEPVFGAQVNVYDNRTQELLNSGITDLEGKVTMRVPGISVDTTVYYRGILIYTDHDHLVSDNALKTLQTDMFYVVFKAIDSNGIPILDATISVISEFTGETLDFGRTDPQGLITLRIPRTSVNVKAEWLGISVYEGMIGITGDRSNTDPIILDCTVHYINVEVLDEMNIPVKDAVVTVISMGLIIESVITDGDGMEIMRLPAGSYQMSVSWNGVLVYYEVVEVISDGNWSFNVNILYLNVEVIDADGLPVFDATVSVINNDYPTIGSTKNTNIDGNLTFRLPTGSYYIAVRWKDRLTWKIENYHLDTSKDLLINADIFYLSIEVVDERDLPLENAFITVFHIEMDEVYDAQISDDSGRIMVRVPVGTYHLEVVWLQKLVHREDDVIVDDNREMTLNADVYYLTMIALSEEGDPVSDVEVQVYDEKGMINSGKPTDGNGTAEFRLPGDEYTIEMFLKKTVNFKRIEKNRTRYVSLGSSQIVEVKFQEYPPSFVSTPLFYASLLPIFLLLLIFAVVAFLYVKRAWEKMGPLEEMEEVNDRGITKRKDSSRKRDHPPRGENDEPEE